MVRFLGLAAILVGCGSDPAPPIEPGWMAGVADERLISELTIPGTHESGANHEPALGVAKCQELTIGEQLDAGIRYFDIRCRHVADAFAIFHGPIDQLQTFDDVMATMTDFLDAHPTEVVMMSIKEESDPVDTTRSFEDTFASYVAHDPGRWHLADEVPAIGTVRGKLLLVRRFAATAAPLGIDASTWQDDTTFTMTTTHATIRVQDAYKVTDLDAKWNAIVALIDEARAASPATLFLDYTSGYVSHGVPNNLEVSDDINPRIEALVRDTTRPHARLGVLAMDHVTDSRVQAVLAFPSM